MPKRDASGIRSASPAAGRVGSGSTGGYLVDKCALAHVALAEEALRNKSTDYLPRPPQYGRQILELRRGCAEPAVAAAQLRVRHRRRALYFGLVQHWTGSAADAQPEEQELKDPVTSATAPAAGDKKDHYITSEFFCVFYNELYIL